MHGYENRWPLIRSDMVTSLNGSGEGSDGLEIQVSAVRPDIAPTGIVGGSGLFSAIGGRYNETIKRDPEQPDLYAGTISLAISAK